MSVFYAVKRLLAHWPERSDAETTIEDSTFDRLRRALRGLADGRTGRGDLAGLIRQILAQQASRVDDAKPPELTVPRAPGWPSRDEWIAFGVEVRAEEPSRFHLRVRVWRPDWLDGGDASPIDDALRETPRRHDASVPADPAFSELLDPEGRHYRRYGSPGQRDAVRAAFLLPPGATLLVDLPTGAGKSLVFQAPAMAARLDGALTLIIVPTVALARDLECRFRPLFDDREPNLAYHGGLAPELKRAMRARIRAGEQTVVITSPESALGALRAALFDAAQAGRLRYLVIDEAHLIAQWGTEFRPEFQLLAGLRRGLLAASPRDRQARTILATATLTAETWWTLSTLFGEMEVVAAVHLRPEPSYWIHAATDEEDRRAKVLKAVRHVPRPFILYTSRPEDATRWRDELRGIGMLRTGVVRGGDMSTEAGANILEQWASRELDAIVATSAFGLGVDQADVRTVIHACVPETVDRYYQEVGRAGRDGKAAFSLVVYTPNDLQIARRLAEERIIGITKGLSHWNAMFQARESGPEKDVFFVPLTARPAHLRQDSKANEAWNRRTLLLMARMGLIVLDAKSPPPLEPAEGEGEEAFDARCRSTLDQFFKKCAVRIVHGSHFSPSYWERKRTKAKDAGSNDDAKQMEDLLACKAPLSETFARTYTVSDIGVVPEIAGGGCPVSRRRGDGSHGYVTPPASPIQRVVDLVDRSVASPVVGKDEIQLVSYVPPGDAEEEARWRGMNVDLLGRLVTRGVVEVAVGASLAVHPEVRGLWRKSPIHFVIQRGLDEEDGPLGEPRTARVTVVDPSAATGRYGHLLGVSRPFHMLIIPTTFPEGGGRGRPLVDLRPHLPLRALLSRLDR